MAGEGDLGRAALAVPAGGRVAAAVGPADGDPAHSGDSILRGTLR